MIWTYKIDVLEGKQNKKITRVKKKISNFDSNSSKESITQTLVSKGRDSWSRSSLVTNVKS